MLTTIEKLNLFSLFSSSRDLYYTLTSVEQRKEVQEFVRANLDKTSWDEEIKCLQTTNFNLASMIAVYKIYYFRIMILNIPVLYCMLSNYWGQSKSDKKVRHMEMLSCEMQRDQPIPPYKIHGFELFNYLSAWNGGRETLNAQCGPEEIQQRIQGALNHVLTAIIVKDY